MFESTAYRWVPSRAWPEFEREFNAAEGQLQAAVDTYETDYATIRETVLDTFRELAADSARRLSATGEAVPDDFEDVVVREVMATLPTPELLRQRLSVRYRVGVIQLGSEFLAEQRKAAEERRRLEALDAERRSEERRRQAEERVVQEQLWVLQERHRRDLQAEEEERRREAAIKERLRELKLEAARERLAHHGADRARGAAQRICVASIGLTPRLCVAGC